MLCVSTFDCTLYQYFRDNSNYKIAYKIYLSPTYSKWVKNSDCIYCKCELNLNLIVNKLWFSVWKYYIQFTLMYILLKFSILFP